MRACRRRGLRSSWFSGFTLLQRPSSLCSLDAKLSPDDAFHLGGDEGAWRPDAEPGLIAAQLPWRDGREALNVGEAVAGPDQVRVYLFWHQL